MTRPALARPPAPLSSELARALSPAEEALGGCAVPHGNRRTAAPTPGAVLSLYRLLVHVTGETAPPARVVAAWHARDRAMVRLWAERELCRKVTGTDGCPALAVPPALVSFWGAA